jgi:hypothetical protein
LDVDEQSHIVSPDIWFFFGGWWIGWQILVVVATPEV